MSFGDHWHLSIVAVHELTGSGDTQLTMSDSYVLTRSALWDLVNHTLPRRVLFDNLVKNCPPALARKDEILELIENAENQGTEAYKRAQMDQEHMDESGQESDATVGKTTSLVEKTRSSGQNDIPHAFQVCKPSTTLWSVKTPSSSVKAGPSVSKSTPHDQSALFGNALPKGPAADREALQSKLLKEILSQVDVSTSLGQKAAVAAVVDDTPPAAKKETAAAASSIVPEQVPFVPTNNRKTKTTTATFIQKDQVVPVKKSKKRKAAPVDPTPVPRGLDTDETTPSPAKRSKSESSSAATTPAKQTTKGKSANKAEKRAPVNPADIPTFDYSQEPNQLDTFAPESDKKIKKTKKPKKRECVLIASVIHSKDSFLTVVCYRV